MLLIFGPDFIRGHDFFWLVFRRGHDFFWPVFQWGNDCIMNVPNETILFRKYNSLPKIPENFVWVALQITDSIRELR